MDCKSDRPSGCDAVPSDDGEPHTFTWRVHLAAREPGKALVAIAIIAVVGWAAMRAFGTPWHGIGASVILLLAVAEFLFPVTYRLSAEGAESSNLLGGTVMRWERVRRYDREANGLKLSPFAHPHPLDRWRGIYLRFAGNEDSVVEWVDAMMTQSRANAQDREDGSDMGGRCDS